MIPIDHTGWNLSTFVSPKFKAPLMPICHTSWKCCSSVYIPPKFKVVHFCIVKVQNAADDYMSLKLQTLLLPLCVSQVESYPFLCHQSSKRCWCLYVAQLDSAVHPFIHHPSSKLSIKLYVVKVLRDDDVYMSHKLKTLLLPLYTTQSLFRRKWWSTRIKKYRTSRKWSTKS